MRDFRPTSALSTPFGHAKAAARACLRGLLPRVPVRGRYRIAQILGERLAPAHPESIGIGVVSLPIDHRIPMYRYVYYGLYEASFVAHLRRVLRPGDVFLDGGTNIGYIAAVAADLVGRRGRVIGFEPSRTCYAIAASALAVSENVLLIPAALSDTEGSTEFADAPNAVASGASLLARFGVPPEAAIYPVTTVTIDAVMERERVGAARYLKLDVEEAELLALRGAERALRTGAIDFVLVEMDYADCLDERNQAIHDLLARNGYAPHVLARAGRLRPLVLAEVAGLRRDVVWQFQGSPPRGHD